MNAIAVVSDFPKSEIIVTQTVGMGQQSAQYVWAEFYDIGAALKVVNNHLQDLGSDGYEQHTRRVYEPGLKYFYNWAAEAPVSARKLIKIGLYDLPVIVGAHRMVTADLMQEYIAHLKRERGLKASTINSKYLAPLRLYVKALAGQYVGVTGQVRDFVNDVRHFMTQALNIKVKEDNKKSSHSALYSQGKRLNVAQVSAVFSMIGQEDDLRAKRDLALMYIGFNAALRVAEIQRMTLDSIQSDGGGWRIVVRGKRNNFDPVPLDEMGYKLIVRWVEAFNAGLPAGDARRIERDTPIWQVIAKGGGYQSLAVNGYDPQRGLSVQAITAIVSQRVLQTVGVKISPHDMRRTAAAIARQNGMGYDVIQQLLRHSSVATTQKYVGNPPNLSASLLSNVVEWGIAV